MKIEYSKILITGLAFFNFNINSIDNPHFYKATHFWEEPRFEKDNLNSFQFWFGGGKTSTGYNGSKNKVNVLQIYGPENILHNKIEFNGLFKMLELDIDFKRNFYHGFFGEIHLPIRKLEIEDISFKNFSDPCGKNTNNYQGRLDFITKFKCNMKKYGIDINKFESAGVGDMSLLLGFTTNYEDTYYIDFIDFTVKAGLILPTGKTQSLKNPFALPLGYNGHLGFNGDLNISLGLYEWLTFGAYTSFIAFVNKTKNVRIKTDYEQNGFIKLTKACAEVQKGTIFSIGGYIKADHILRGFSFLMAYRFDKEYRTRLRQGYFGQAKQMEFDVAIANSDQQLLGWYMNTINIIGEYDFATYENPNRPRIEAFCDFSINGKRIFKTDIFGFGFNIDYCW